MLGHNFGDASMATKDTAVACANPMDFGALHAKSRFSKRHTGLVPGLRIVFQNTAVMAAGDSWIPMVYDSADNSTYNEIARGPETAAAAAAYTRKIVDVPPVHRRYLNAWFMPKSTGTFTAKTGQAWIENGPNIQDQ